MLGAYSEIQGGIRYMLRFRTHVRERMEYVRRVKSEIVGTGTDWFEILVRIQEKVVYFWYLYTEGKKSA